MFKEKLLNSTLLPTAISGCNVIPSFSSVSSDSLPLFINPQNRCSTGCNGSLFSYCVTENIVLISNISDNDLNPKSFNNIDGNSCSYLDKKKPVLIEAFSEASSHLLHLPWFTVTCIALHPNLPLLAIGTAEGVVLLTHACVHTLPECHGKRNIQNLLNEIFESSLKNDTIKSKKGTTFDKNVQSLNNNIFDQWLNSTALLGQNGSVYAVESTGNLSDINSSDNYNNFQEQNSYRSSIIVALILLPPIVPTLSKLSTSNKIIRLSPVTSISFSHNSFLFSDSNIDFNIKDKIDNTVSFLMCYYSTNQKIIIWGIDKGLNNEILKESRKSLLPEEIKSAYIIHEKNIFNKNDSFINTELFSFANCFPVHIAGTTTGNKSGFAVCQFNTIAYYDILVKSNENQNSKRNDDLNPDAFSNNAIIFPNTDIAQPFKVSLKIMASLPSSVLQKHNSLIKQQFPNLAKFSSNSDNPSDKNIRSINLFLPKFISVAIPSQSSINKDKDDIQTSSDKDNNSNSNMNLKNSVIIFAITNTGILLSIMANTGSIEKWVDCKLVNSPTVDIVSENTNYTNDGFNYINLFNNVLDANNNILNNSISWETLSANVRSNSLSLITTDNSSINNNINNKYNFYSLANAAVGIQVNDTHVVVAGLHVIRYFSLYSWHFIDAVKMSEIIKFEPQGTQNKLSNNFTISIPHFASISVLSNTLISFIGVFKINTINNQKLNNTFSNMVINVNNGFACFSIDSNVHNDVNGNSSACSTGTSINNTSICSGTSVNSTNATIKRVRIFDFDHALVSLEGFHKKIPFFYNNINDNAIHNTTLNSAPCNFWNFIPNVPPTCSYDEYSSAIINPSENHIIVWCEFLIKIICVRTLCVVATYVPPCTNENDCTSRIASVCWHPSRAVIIAAIVQNASSSASPRVLVLILRGRQPFVKTVGNQIILVEVAKYTILADSIANDLTPNNTTSIPDLSQLQLAIEPLYNGPLELVDDDKDLKKHSDAGRFVLLTKWNIITKMNNDCNVTLYYFVIILKKALTTTPSKEAKLISSSNLIPEIGLVSNRRINLATFFCNNTEDGPVILLSSPLHYSNRNLCIVTNKGILNTTNNQIMTLNDNNLNFSRLNGTCKQNNAITNSIRTSQRIVIATSSPPSISTIDPLSFKRTVIETLESTSKSEEKNVKVSYSSLAAHRYLHCIAVLVEKDYFFSSLSLTTGSVCNQYSYTTSIMIAATAKNSEIVRGLLSNQYRYFGALSFTPDGEHLLVICSQIKKTASEGNNSKQLHFFATVLRFPCDSLVASLQSAKEKHKYSSRAVCLTNYSIKMKNNTNNREVLSENSFNESVSDDFLPCVESNFTNDSIILHSSEKLDNSVPIASNFNDFSDKNHSNSNLDELVDTKTEKNITKGIDLRGPPSYSHQELKKTTPSQNELCLIPKNNNNQNNSFISPNQPQKINRFLNDRSGNVKNNNKLSKELPKQRPRAKTAEKKRSVVQSPTLNKRFKGVQEKLNALCMSSKNNIVTSPNAYLVNKTKTDIFNKTAKICSKPDKDERIKANATLANKLNELDKMFNEMCTHSNKRRGISSHAEYRYDGFSFGSISPRSDNDQIIVVSPKKRYEEEITQSPLVFAEHVRSDSQLSISPLSASRSNSTANVNQNAFNQETFIKAKTPESMSCDNVLDKACKKFVQTKENIKNTDFINRIKTCNKDITAPIDSSPSSPDVRPGTSPPIRANPDLVIVLNNENIQCVEAMPVTMKIEYNQEDNRENGSKLQNVMSLNKTSISESDTITISKMNDIWNSIGNENLPLTDSVVSGMKKLNDKNDTLGDVDNNKKNLQGINAHSIHENKEVLAMMKPKESQDNVIANDSCENKDYTDDISENIVKLNNLTEVFSDKFCQPNQINIDITTKPITSISSPVKKKRDYSPLKSVGDHKDQFFFTKELSSSISLNLRTKASAHYDKLQSLILTARSSLEDARALQAAVVEMTSRPNTGTKRINDSNDSGLVFTSNVNSGVDDTAIDNLDLPTTQSLAEHTLLLKELQRIITEELQTTSLMAALIKSKK